VLVGSSSAVGVVVLLWLVSLWRRERPVRDGAGLAEITDESYRLRCVGRPETLLDVGPFHDVPFEPRTFRLLGGEPATWPRIVAWVIVGYVGVSAFCWLWMTVFRTQTVLVHTLGGVFLTLTLLTIFVPTHVHVMPGWLEIHTHIPLLKPLIRRIDLRNARLIVDLRNWLVRIDEPNRRKPITFSIWLLPRRRALAHALYLGALSSHGPPPEQDDDEPAAPVTDDTASLPANGPPDLTSEVHFARRPKEPIRTAHEDYRLVSGASCFVVVGVLTVIKVSSTLIGGGPTAFLSSPG
jgi:hypothetical protein